MQAAASVSPGRTQQPVNCRLTEGLYPTGPREASESSASRCLHKGLSGLTRPCQQPCRLVPGNAVLYVGFLWGSPSRARTCGDSVGPPRGPSGRWAGPGTSSATRDVCIPLSLRGPWRCERRTAPAGPETMPASFGDRQRESRGRWRAMRRGAPAPAPRTGRDPRRDEGWLAARLSGSRRHPRQYACMTLPASGRRRPDAGSVGAITQRD